MNKKLIKRVAEAVLNTFDITPPVEDMADVVRTLGGELITVNSLPDYVYGEIEKSNNSFIMKVATNQPATRLRFTIAHELGHLFLHMGYRIDDELWQQSSTAVYKRSGNSALEKDANEFAANFLMPEEIFTQKMYDFSTDNKVNIDKLATYFNVSVDAAINRGKWLGYFSW